MNARRRMTSIEFDFIVPLLRISEKRIKAAYGALVNGRKLQEIGDELGCTRQAVHDAVNVVWRTYKNYESLPYSNNETFKEKDFRRICAILNEYQAYQVRQWDTENKKYLAEKAYNGKEEKEAK